MPTAPDHLAQLKSVAELQKKATKGPWFWNVNLKSKRIVLESQGTPGNEIVMDFTRWGMGGAKVRFIRRPECLMVDGDTLAVPVEGRKHHADWYRTIDHPDATFIAAARSLPLAAIAEEVERLRSHHLGSIQSELQVWQEHNFPGREWEQPFMGVVEEVGELSHALLKQKQGIRGTSDEHEEAAKDAVADTIIFLLDLCNARGWDAALIVSETWEKVRQRNWRPEKGPLPAALTKEPA